MYMCIHCMIKVCTAHCGHSVIGPIPIPTFHRPVIILVVSALKCCSGAGWGTAWGESVGSCTLVHCVVGYCRRETVRRLALVHVVHRWLCVQRSIQSSDMQRYCYACVL